MTVFCKTDMGNSHIGFLFAANSMAGALYQSANSHRQSDSASKQIAYE